MLNKQNTVIYLPTGIDANTRWEIVAAALCSVGITDIRPAPMPSMRRSHHAPGTAIAQSTLMALAGWTPNRRSILTSMLAIPAVTIPAVAAIPSPSSTPGCGLATPLDGVSPTMAGLIAEFVRLSAVLDDADGNDHLAWERAADARGPALDALVFHRPSNIAELAAKMTALVTFVQEEDGELFAFRVLAEDATLLAGSAN